MKQTLTYLFFLVSSALFAQIDVEGKLKLADDGAAPAPGMVRYLDGDFEGYDGATWRSFWESGDQSTPVTAPICMGQSYQIDVDNSSLDTCGVIYDSGGPAGDYGNDENELFTIDGMLAGAVLRRVIVQSYDIQNNVDELRIIAGTDSISYTGQSIEADTLYFASNQSIKVRFISDASNPGGPYDGFEVSWSTLFVGDQSAPDQLAGFFFYPDKQSIGGGIQVADNWQESGNRSVQFGYATDASATASIALGAETKALATQSIAIGQAALASNQSAIGVGEHATSTQLAAIAIGRNTQSLGNHTVAIGDSSTAANSSSVAHGNNATATGISSLAAGAQTKATGQHAIAIGRMATTAGFEGLALGNEAMSSNDYSVAIGNESQATGNASVALGNLSESSAVRSTAIGNGARALDGSAVALGNQATSDGASAMALGASSNSSANSSVAIGRSSSASAANAVATGPSSVAQGVSSVALGHLSKSFNDNALALGAFAEARSEAVAIGRGADADGTNSISIGRFSKSSQTESVALGSQALATGTRSVALGTKARAEENGSVAIGYNAVSSMPAHVVIGNTLIDEIGGYATWSFLSDGRFKNNLQENVPGLDFISKLRPLTYTVDYIKLSYDRNIKLSKEDLKRAHEKSQNIQSGFIAQEVEATARELGYAFDGVNAPDNATDHYTVSYSTFVVPLVKAVQELEEKNINLQQENDTLKERLADIERRLSAME